MVDIAVTGDKGVIDGQGLVWWLRHSTKKEIYTRGHLIEFMNSSDILLENLILKNSPFWTVHPWSCDNVRIKNVKVKNPVYSPNTDGIDPDSSSNVVIEDFSYTGSDDAISIKSGWGCFGLDYNVSSKNILIKNITTHYGESGVAIGSEVSGGIENITVLGGVFHNPVKAGVRIKSGQGRGAYIKNVLYDGITVKDGIKLSKNEKMIDINQLEYGDNPECHGRNESALTLFENISIQNLIGKTRNLPIVVLKGSPDLPLIAIHLKNINIKTKKATTN